VPPFDAGEPGGSSGPTPAGCTYSVDAVWLSHFYLSPQVDAGYDVADYAYRSAARLTSSAPP